MAKKSARKNSNLNKRKGTHVILLLLALSFVVVPLITLIISIISVNSLPWM